MTAATSRCFAAAGWKQIGGFLLGLVNAIPQVGLVGGSCLPPPHQWRMGGVYAGS